jgi:hypothetical protein
MLRIKLTLLFIAFIVASWWKPKEVEDMLMLADKAANERARRKLVDSVIGRGVYG